METIIFSVYFAAAAAIRVLSFHFYFKIVEDSCEIEMSIVNKYSIPFFSYSEITAIRYAIRAYTYGLYVCA